MGSFYELFSVKQVLNSKGFRVNSEGDGSDTLIPVSRGESKENDALFEAMNDHLRRSQLLSKIAGNQVVISHPSVMEVTNHSKYIEERIRYSRSFEWYVGELMIRRFGAFSASYGVEISDVLRNSSQGLPGDYDAIVILRDLNFIYLECTTGVVDEDKVKKTLERAISIHCEFCLLLTEGALGLEKLAATIRGTALPTIYGRSLDEITIKGSSAKGIICWNNLFFINAEGNIEEQVRTAIRINSAKKLSHSDSWQLAEEDFDRLGYKMTSIAV